jgi:hypothetical protein
MSQTKLPRRRAAGNLVGVILGAAAVVFVGSLLLISSYTLAANTSGVTLTKPYAGTAYTGQSASFSGVGCPGTGNLSFTPPYFSVTNGKGGVGQASDSQPCKSWVTEYHQFDADFGLNGAAFNPSKLVTKDFVKFHWTMTYWLLVNTTWAGGNDTTYAYASVALGAWVYDVTTGNNVGSQSVFFNFTYLLDSAGQIYIVPYHVHVVMVVKVTLKPSNRYEFESYVETETRAETIGPLGSANTAYAQVGFYGTGPKAMLTSITY